MSNLPITYNRFLWVKNNEILLISVNTQYKNWYTGQPNNYDESIVYCGKIFCFLSAVGVCLNS